MDIKEEIKMMYPDLDSFKKLPPVYKGYTHITKEDILKAQEVANSAAMAARELGVAYSTYRKYCDKFEIPHMLEKFNKKERYETDTSEKLKEVLDGKTARYTYSNFKKHITSGKFVDCKCSNCGFSERRITDDNMPILIDFLDNNPLNMKWENLRILCYNCYFLIVGNFVGKKSGGRVPPKLKKGEVDLSEIDLSLL